MECSECGGNVYIKTVVMLKLDTSENTDNTNSTCSYINMWRCDKCNLEIEITKDSMPQCIVMMKSRQR